MLKEVLLKDENMYPKKQRTQNTVTTWANIKTFFLIEISLKHTNCLKQK